jgi:hypothetical protein
VSEGSGSEATGHAQLDAVNGLHAAVRGAIGRTLARDAVHSALVAVWRYHRPKIDEPEAQAARDGRLFPGWRALCTGCSQGAGFGRHYPCQTMRAICEELGVEIPEVLR